MSQRFPPHRGYAPRPHPSRFEHSDRWNGRAGERSRSPIRDRRDSRDFPPPPRDLHLERQPPRFPRDGPQSAGPNPPTQRFPPPTYGRGRGGRPQDWEFRGRPRYPEEREPFRRSPSRGPPRRERQGSVDSRDFERRDDRRDEYRDRHDDEWRFRGRNEYPPRRDPPPRIDTRHASDARSDSVPSPVDRSGRLPSPHRRPSPVDKRDYDTPRRASMMDHSNKDGRRESGRSDPGRPPRDRSPDPVPVRPAAEETSSVAVPQFGFIPPILPTTPAKTPVSPIPASKPIPTAPRAHLPVNIPTGPKAERIAEQQPSILNKETVQSPIEEQKISDLPPPATVSVNISPAAPAHPMFRQESPSLNRIQSLENSVSPRVQQLVPPSAPNGPRSSSQPLRASSAGPPARSLSPSIPLAPLGPRVALVPQLPKGLPENIPTGPRAMSRVPPTAPRNHRQQVTSLQWRPNQPVSSQRAPSLGVKRDANGEEKEKTPVPERLFEPNRAPLYGLENKRALDSPLQTFASVPNRTEKQDEDVQMVDAPLKPSPISPEASMKYLLSDDDEGQGLDEDDFAEQAERYRRKKAELEGQLEVLDRRHQPISPLQELDKGNAILAILDEIGLRPSPEPSPEPSPQPIPEVIMTEDVPEDVPPTKSPTPEETQSPAAPREDPSIRQDIPPVVVRELTPEMSKSPDFQYLPYLPDQPPTPTSDPEQLEISVDDDLANLVQEKLQQIDDEENDNQIFLQETFAQLYKPWRKMGIDLERERDQQLAQSTEVQPPVPVEVPEPVVDQIVPPLLTPTESRRLHRYASELDLERALEESRREEEERRLRVEKEKKEALAHVEREADIPLLLTPHQLEIRTFRDTSLQREPNEALHIFEFEPPVDKFTEAQSREFTRLWKGHPKMWHKIADDLGISTKDCIYHYYATKWDKPYKHSKARRPKKSAAGRRGAMLGGRVRLDADNDSTDAATGLTETGRPRRAAAPTFSKPAMGKGDTDADVEGIAPAGRRTAGKQDGTADGKGGTRGKSARERPGRKPKNQPLAAKTLAAASPQKNAREKKEKPGSVMPTMMGEPDDWVTKVEPVPPQDRLMPVLIPQQQQQHYQQMQQPQMYMTEPMNLPHYRTENPNLAPMDPNASPASARPRSYSNTQKNNASSYWSVQEETEFQACLAYYGTDFQQISLHINKKTPVMVCIPA
jgi:serine/arginine repetitive matrix protein 2